MKISFYGDYSESRIESREKRLDKRFLE